MMHAEHLQDAITLLPDELLSPVEALRQKKATSWKKAVAVAASVLLVIGLWHLHPMAKTGASSDAMGDINNAPMDGVAESDSEEHLTTDYAYNLSAVVAEIGESHLTVTLSDGKTATVYFDNLQTQKTFLPGQEISLLFVQDPKDSLELYPDKIVIK